jgi:hypothetical protein
MSTPADFKRGITIIGDVLKKSSPRVTRLSLLFLDIGYQHGTPCRVLNLLSKLPIQNFHLSARDIIHMDSKLETTSYPLLTELDLEQQWVDLGKVCHYAKAMPNLKHFSINLNVYKVSEQVFNACSTNLVEFHILEVEFERPLDKPIREYMAVVRYVDCAPHYT